MEGLPKLLLSMLDQLCSDKKLYHWNLQANGDYIHVNLKFVPVDHTDESTSVPSMRRKSPSEKNRDFQRLNKWRVRHSSLIDSSCAADDPDMQDSCTKNASVQTEVKDNSNVKSAIVAGQYIRPKPQSDVGHVHQTVSDTTLDSDDDQDLELEPRGLKTITDTQENIMRSPPIKFIRVGHIKRLASKNDCSILSIHSELDSDSSGNNNVGTHFFNQHDYG